MDHPTADEAPPRRTIPPQNARWRRGPEQVALPGQPCCELCRQPRGRSLLLCTDHLTDLDHLLDPAWEGDRDLALPASIPVYWSRLDPTPAVTGTGTRAPGYASTPPLALDPVVLTDTRSSADPRAVTWYAQGPDGRPDFDRPFHERTDRRPVAPTLAALVQDMWFTQPLPGPPLPLHMLPGVVRDSDVPALAAWLHHHHLALAVRDDVYPLMTMLLDLQHQLRTVTGDPADRPIGWCTGWVRDHHTGVKVECGAQLYEPPPRPGVQLKPNSPVIICARCGRPYTALGLLRLQIGKERGGDGDAR